jgi:hypothetical protein
MAWYGPEGVDSDGGVSVPITRAAGPAAPCEGRGALEEEDSSPVSTLLIDGVFLAPKGAGNKKNFEWC